MTSNYWLFSDPHFWHDNIYKFVNASGIRVRERFTSEKEGREYMVDRWRTLVQPSDHIWCLGDLCMHRGNHHATEFIALVKSLPGHKRLILGNHDHYATGVYTAAGFEKVRASNVYDGLLMTHYPVHASSIGPRLIGNVHGHTHDHPDIGPQYLNVSCERTNYEPIHIEEVKARLRVKIPPPTQDVSGNQLGGL